MPRPARSGTLWLRGVAAAAIVTLLIGGWVTWQRPDPEPVPLTVGTGLPGGVYHAFGLELERVTQGSGTPLTARTTPASVANLELVTQGEIDVGFTLEDVAVLAVEGREPFGEPLPVRALGRLYDNHTHVVVRADAAHQGLPDLAGGVVSVGAAGSGTEMIAERLLEQAGLTPGAVDLVRLDLEESAAALEGGTVDAFVWSGGLPTQAVSDLAARTPVRLLDLAEWVEPLAAEHGMHYYELPVPAGTYPGVPGVRTVGVPSVLVVRADLPDHVAEGLTRTLFEARDELGASLPVALQMSERSAIATLPVPLHPGALRYYEDVKPGHSPRSAPQGRHRVAALPAPGQAG